MSRKLAVLSNCLANQNAKVAELEVARGAMFPLVDILRDADYHIVQMPCPEMTFMGCGRWWQSRSQYDTPGYRRHCRTLAESVADLLVGAGAVGADEVILFGIDGSPSSGVGITSHAPDWGGRPMKHPTEHVYGRGVWMEELLSVFAERDLPEPRLLGVGTELSDYDPAFELQRVREFIASDDHEASRKPPAPRTGTPSDKQGIVRSKRIMVMPDGGMNDAALCAEIEADGWGILQLPPETVTGDDLKRALTYAADQVQDYLNHDHVVEAASGPGVEALNAELAARKLAPLAVRG